MDFREETNDSNAFQFRIDHHFSTKDNIFFRWTERRITGYLPQNDVAYKTPESINRNWGGGWFHTFSPSMILEVRGGVATQPTEDAPMEHPAGLAPQQGTALPSLDELQGYVISGLSTSPWSLQANQLGVQGPRPRENPNWNVAADLTWLRGKHNFKAGFQMLRISRLQKNQFGELIYDADPTRNAQGSGSTGDVLASALLGLPGQIRGYVPDLGFIDFHTSTLSGYVQDQWSVKPNLTLTYGLRYDYITRAYGESGTFQSGPDFRTGEWLLALPEPPPVCSTVGNAPPCLPKPLDQIPYNQYIRVTGEYNAVLPPIKDNFGPRVGLAWQINPETVLRDRLLADVGLDGLEEPVRPAPVRDLGLAAGLGLRHGHDQHHRGCRPAARELLVPGDRSASSRALEQHRLLQRARPQERLLAPVAPGDPAPAHPQPDGGGRLRGQLQRPDGVLRARRGAQDGGNRPGHGTEAHAGRAERASAVGPHHRGLPLLGRHRDVQVQRVPAQGAAALRRGLHQRCCPTPGRSPIDTSSGWFDAEGGIGGRPVQNYWDIDDARGISAYDIPHILTWASIWELPVRPGKALAERRRRCPGSSGNWQMSWMLLARSGQPMTVTAGGDPANLGFSNYARADLVGDPNLDDPTAGPVVQQGGLRRAGQRLRELRPEHPARAELLERGPDRCRRTSRSETARQLRVPAGAVQRLQPHQRRQPEHGHHQRELRHHHRHVGPPAAGSVRAAVRLLVARTG